MDMGEHYGLPDLRQFMGRRTLFPAVPQAAEQLSGNGDLSNRQHFEMMMMMGGHHVGDEGMLPLGAVDFHHPDHHSTSTSTAADAAPSTSEKETCINGGDGGNGRWPRQETLTLLEIRSLLDPKFKEANQKGPLWDEVSRIMAEEHGYQRSGKKCREKFENLYKYYKKTKESKAGRQDGKHYRFFRQLEALYGETEKEANSTPPPPPVTAASETFRFQPTSNDSNPQQANQLVQEASQSQQKHCESLSLSNSSDFDTSSSDDSVEKKKLKMQDNQSQKRGRKSWKVKIRDFVDLQMRKLVEKQETWLEKMLKTLESKEKERISREEAWRKEETARLDREYKFWAHERAWVEARDAALMDALHKFTAREPKALSPEDENGSETLNDCSANNNCGGWEEHEISCLIKLKINMESSFQETGGSNAMLWEEVSSKMACLGYNRSAKSCNGKWESINISKNMGRSSSMECNNLKGLKQNSRTRASFHNNLHLPFRQGTHEEQVPETSPSPSNSNSRTAVHDSCFRYLMAEEEPLWQNYDVKLNKGDDNSS